MCTVFVYRDKESKKRTRIWGIVFLLMIIISLFAYKQAKAGNRDSITGGKKSILKYTPIFAKTVTSCDPTLWGSTPCPLIPFQSTDWAQIYIQAVRNGGNTYSPTSLCSSIIPFQSTDAWQVYCAIKNDSGTGSLKYAGNFAPVFNTHLSGDSLTFTCIQEGGGLFYAGPQNPATFACPAFRFIYGLDLTQKILHIDTSSISRPAGSFIVSTGANSSKGGAIAQASYLTTTLSFHPDTTVIPKHTTAYTPLYDGEKWRYIANGDTTECTAVKTATGFRVDSVTLNVAGIAWTPTFTGFSVNPTQITATYKWQAGRVLLIHLIMTPGTSNSTSFTITAPFKTMYTETNAQDFTDATNNSVNGGFAVVSFQAGSAILTLGLGATSLPWTASGTKGVGGYISYFANP